MWRKIFSFVYFLFFHVFFDFSSSDIPYFCSLSSFFNLPAPGLHRSSYTERNSTHVVLNIWKIWKSWDKQRRICQVPSFPLPYPKSGKVGIYVCLSALHFFLRLERNGIFLVAPPVCSLSRLWVGREISWSCGHNVSLVDIVGLSFIRRTGVVLLLLFFAFLVFLLFPQLLTYTLLNLYFRICTLYLLEYDSTS